jgi:hypothetical protein
VRRVRGRGTTRHDGRGQGAGVSKGKNKKKKYLQVDALARGQGERGVMWRAVGEGTRHERMGCAQKQVSKGKTIKKKGAYGVDRWAQSQGVNQPERPG